MDEFRIYKIAIVFVILFIIAVEYIIIDKNNEIILEKGREQLKQELNDEFKFPVRVFNNETDETTYTDVRMCSELFVSYYDLICGGAR